MQSLSSNELKYFAKIQGFSLFVATLLLMVNQAISRFTFSPSTQVAYIALAAVFAIVFAANLIFGKQSGQRFTKISVVIYSLLSFGMLVLFLYS